jgi:ABC-type Fe3+/spermidine/putrescine transport system ATPase subunit
MLPGVAGAFDGQQTEVASCGTTVLVQGNVAERGRKLLLSIRPEALRIAQDGDGPLLPTRLVLREFLGQIQRLHASLPDGTPIRASALGSRPIETAAGAALALAYDPAQIIAYPAP